MRTAGRVHRLRVFHEQRFGQSVSHVLQLPEIVEGEVRPGGRRSRPLPHLKHAEHFALGVQHWSRNQFLNGEGVGLFALLRELDGLKNASVLHSRKIIEQLNLLADGRAGRYRR